MVVVDNAVFVAVHVQVNVGQVGRTSTVEPGKGDDGQAIVLGPLGGLNDITPFL